MKKRDVFFLSMCLLWPVCGMLADRYQTDPLLGMFFFFGMIMAGICAGLDLLLAPKTSLIYRIGKHYSLLYNYPWRVSLTGLFWIVLNLALGYIQFRNLLGYLP
jgi:hypothetical protein